MPDAQFDLNRHLGWCVLGTYDRVQSSRHSARQIYTVMYNAYSNSS
jgi:hypothetical protein